MEKVIRYNNIGYYILLFILIALLAFFLHSYYLTMFLLILAVSTLLSILSALTERNKLTFTLDGNEAFCKRGEEYNLKLIVKSKSTFPIVSCSCLITLQNAFVEDKCQQRYINISVPAFGKKIIYINLKPTLCGRVNVTLNEVEISDMFNLVAFKNKKINERFLFNVMPRRKKQESPSLAFENLIDESEKAHKDSAGMEIVEMREYMPGDSLKTIHWKLSAKKEDLYVKERGDNTSDVPILLFELNINSLNDIFDSTYAVIRHYIRQGRGIKVCWAARGEEQLSTATLVDEKEIYGFFERVYMSFCSNDSTHTLSVAKRQLSGGSVLYADGSEEVQIISL